MARQNLSKQEAVVSAARNANANLAQLIASHARDRWSSATLANLTPDRVLQIMRGVVNGSFTAQSELFDLMEDTWPRLKKNLNEVKRETQKVDLIATATSLGTGQKPSARAEKKKEFLTLAMQSMRPSVPKDENSWENGIYDICDAIGKSISVQEILWEQTSTVMGPAVLARAFQFVYPRHYGYFSDNPDLLLSPRGDGSDYIEFPEDKFIIATFKTKSGHLLTSAMLRALATIWIGSNFSYDWALNLAQMFGLPIRWATYDPSNPKLLDEICDMLENMGSAGWGAFPAGTTLELKEAVKDAANNPQSFLMNLADISADILILGQTLTTSQGDRGSQALGTVHAGVRADILETVADWVAEVLNYQFVPALMRLNFGDNDEDPYLSPDIEPSAEELLARANRDKIVIVDMGVEVGRQWFYERHKIPMPGPKDEVLEINPPALAPPPGDGNPNNQTPNPNKAKLVRGKRSTFNAQHSTEADMDDATTKLRDNVLESLTGVEARWTAPVAPFWEQLINYAKSGEVTDAELIATIEQSARVMPEFFTKMKSEEVATALYNATSPSLINGAVRGWLERHRGASRTGDKAEAKS